MSLIVYPPARRAESTNSPLVTIFIIEELAGLLIKVSIFVGVLHKDIKICLCNVPCRRERRRHGKASGDVACGGRCDAPALAAPVGQGRADRERADGNPWSEPTAGQPAFEASMRSGLAGALQGRGVGLLPRGRSGGSGGPCACAARAGGFRE